MPLYRPLTHHLIRARMRGEDRVALDFDTLQSLLGFTLAPQARKDAEWWHNDPKNHHAWTQAYLQAGWALESVKPDPKGEVIFIVAGRPKPRALLVLGLETGMGRFNDRFGPTLARMDARLEETLRPHVTKLAEKLQPPLTRAFERLLDTHAKATALCREHVSPHYERGMDMFFDTAEHGLNWIQKKLSQLRKNKN